MDARVPWGRINIFGGSGIGRGPVYPGLGAESGLLFATRDEQYGGPWFGEKVFWYVQPSYRGPVLIRGGRLDGPQLVRFNGKKLPPSELHIESGETVSWDRQPRGSRGVPSGVRITAPGCYGFQIDGTSFSRIVIFMADLARSGPAGCRVLQRVGRERGVLRITVAASTPSSYSVAARPPSWPLVLVRCWTPSG